MKAVRAQFIRGYAWWYSHQTRKHDAQPLVVASGISLRLWRLYAQAWLVCLLFPILALIHLRPTPRSLLLAVAGLTIFVIGYTWIMWTHPLRMGIRDRVTFHTSLVLLIGFVALVFALSLAYGSAFLWLLVGVSAIAGVLLPARSAFVAVMALTLLTLGSSVALAGGIGAADWLHVVPLVLLVRGLGLDMAGLTRLTSALREVHAARSELARMAVIEERLRMARDLHDLLGHTLSMITLKSELAGRLVREDPARAAQEMREVEQAARQTLREVRAAVAGYRQPTLREELDGARQLLEAAGIDLTIEQTAEMLPSNLDAALAWSVREGVTNVIRHSRGRWCHIRIAATREAMSVEVTNDAAHESRGEPTTPGRGLAGLSERVAALAGQLVAGPVHIDGQAAFRLWVELPLERDE